MRSLNTFNMKFGKPVQRRKFDMIPIYKGTKLSRHKALVSINDRRLTKHVVLICLAVLSSGVRVLL